MNIQLVRVRFEEFGSDWTFAIYGEERDAGALIDEFVDEAKKMCKWEENHDDSAVITDVMNQMDDYGFAYQILHIDEIVVE